MNIKLEKYIKENYISTDIKPTFFKKRAKQEKASMKEEVLEASGLLNQRDEELNRMTVKAQSLALDSESHKKTATQVKKTENKKKIYLYLGIVIIGLLIIYFITCMVCGCFTFDC